MKLLSLCVNQTTINQSIKLVKIEPLLNPSAIIAKKATNELTINSKSTRKSMT